MNIATVSDFRRAVRMGPYAWPGGYDVYGITSDGAALCHDCMGKERRWIADAIATKDDNGWRIVGLDATCNTDGDVTCDHCGVTLQEEFDNR
jgi:hypothetical protein